MPPSRRRLSHLPTAAAPGAGPRRDGPVYRRRASDHGGRNSAVTMTASHCGRSDCSETGNTGRLEAQTESEKERYSSEIYTHADVEKKHRTQAADTRLGVQRNPTRNGRCSTTKILFAVESGAASAAAAISADSPSTDPAGTSHRRARKNTHTHSSNADDRLQRDSGEKKQSSTKK